MSSGSAAYEPVTTDCVQVMGVDGWGLTFGSLWVVHIKMVGSMPELLIEKVQPFLNRH